MNRDRFTAPGWQKACLTIGHGGAAGLVPANTLPSLARALELGVDMVEFDVRRCRDALVLMHDDELTLPTGKHQISGSTLAELQALAPDPDMRIPTLAEALDRVRGHALLNIDLKAAGFEGEVTALVREKGMGGDTLYSSLDALSLQQVRLADPEALTGFSYPEDRRNASGKPWMQPVVTVFLALLRWTLPWRVTAMMTAARRTR